MMLPSKQLQLLAVEEPIIARDATIIIGEVGTAEEEVSTPTTKAQVSSHRICSRS